MPTMLVKIRVANFEKWKKVHATTGLPVVRFLTPVLIECSAREALTLVDHRKEFETMGIEIDPVGEKVFAIRSVPSLVDRENPKEVVRTILEALAFEQPKGGGEEVFLPFLIALSCRSAIRANVALRKEEMEALVTDLRIFDASTTCPHGRPIFFVLPHPDLERRFQRSPR